MASTTTVMQQLLQDFVANLSMKFEEMHQQLVNLNTHLHDIEKARNYGAAINSVQAKMGREAAIEDLAIEMKSFMISAGKSYLESKMEEPPSSNTPQIIGEVANSLLPAPEI